MPAAERALESTGTPSLLSIGDLAERAGVATTALRHYDALGLVRPRRARARPPLPRRRAQRCPRFWSIIEGRQRGLSLEESHAQVH